MPDLIVVKSPFDTRQRDQFVVARDASIETLIGDYLPSGSREGTDLVAVINGQVIQRDTWGVRRLTVGEQLIVIPRLQGGGGGGLIGAVLSIALAVFAGPIALNLGISDALFFGVESMSWATAQAIGGALVTMGGAMLVGALVAPDMPKLPSASLQSYDASPSYAWNPATTQEPGGVISRAYGTVKLYGNVIGGYIRDTGDTGRKQEANLLIDLGTGPYSQLRDFKLNDQALDAYTGVSVEVRMGNLTQTLLPAFDDTYQTHTINAKVVNGTPITRITAGTDMDALEVKLVFPSGLYYANDSGGLSSISVNLRVEFSADSGRSWTPLTRQTISGTTTVASNRWSIGYWYYPSEWGAAEWSEVMNGGTNRSSYIEGQYVDGYQARWITESVVVPTSSTVDYITVSGAQQQSIRRTFRADHLTRGIAYQVRVTNLSTDQTSSRYGDDLYFSELNEIRQDDFTYPRTVLAAVRALATDQISGSMKFECIADAAIVRVWNGSAWSSVWSNNPAWVVWDILTQPVLDNSLAVVRYDGIDPSRLDLTAFYAWAQWCDGLVPDGAGGTEKRCTFDGIFDTPATNWESALEVAASARAVLLLRGTTVTVVYDHARSTPAQLFGGGNTIDGSFREVFLPMQERASAIEVEYIDAADDHARNKLTVVNTAVTESAAQRVQFSNRGIRRVTQAWREAMYRLEKNRLLKRTAELSAGIDAIACTVGDLVWVQNDITRWGEGGRVVSGTTTTVTLDREVTLAPATTYEIRVRFADDTLATRTITTAAGTVSAITVSSAFASAPALHDLWAIGVTDAAIKEFLVTSIRRNSDQQATISLIEYNSTLYNVDTGNPVLPTPNVAYYDMPDILNLTLAEGMERANDGTINVFVDVSFQLHNAKAGRIMQRRPGSGTYDVLGDSAVGTWRINNVASGVNVSIQVAPVTHVGTLAPPAAWRRASLAVIGKTAPPSDIQTAALTGLVLAWSAVDDIDLAGYQVRWTPTAWPDWFRATPLHEGLITESPFTIPYKPQGGLLMVKAMDTSGNASINAATIGLPIDVWGIENSIQSYNLADAGFPGEKSGCTVISGHLLADSADPLMWDANGDSAMWALPTSAMYDSLYAAMAYETSWGLAPPEVPSTIALDIAVQGAPYGIEYRRNNSGPWLAWPGRVNAESGLYNWKVTAASGATQGAITTMIANMEVPERRTTYAQVSISAAGTRLPIGSDWHSIRAVVLTVQDDGGSAVSARTMDKLATGPLIKCFNTAGTAVAGTIDADVIGY